MYPTIGPTLQRAWGQDFMGFYPNVAVFPMLEMRSSGGVAFASRLPGHSELLYSRVATAQEDRVQLEARVTSATLP